MGLVGREIVQSRAYLDPNARPITNLNYNYTFPITVFDAVRESMSDESSKTLTEVLNWIYQELRQKQPIFAGKPANFLMTYAGVSGGVGSIEMSRNIPWDPTLQTHDRIPTEKAVGDLMFKLGLVDEKGNVINDPESKHVRWSDVIGRPQIYTGLGESEDGFMTQKATSKAVRDLEIKLSDIIDSVGNRIDDSLNRFRDHINNTNNPHAVTAEQVGATPMSIFRYHTEEAVNPHGITREFLGLELVDNTRDEDKPLSAATRQAVAMLLEKISLTDKNVADLNFITDAAYDQKSGRFSVTFRDGSEIIINIPINGLIDEIKYDVDTKELIFIEIGGTQKRVSIKDLFIRYIGSNNAHVIITIDGDQISGEQVIKAELKPKSVGTDDIADWSIVEQLIGDGAVTTNKIKDLSVTTVKIANGSVTTEKVAVAAITNSRIADRSVDGRTLFSSDIPYRVLAVTSPGSNPIWTLIREPMIDDNAIIGRHINNLSIGPEHLKPKSVTTSKIDEMAVTWDKLASDAVRAENIANFSITGNKLVMGICLPGRPSIEISPKDSANNSQIPDTRWVRNAIAASVFGTNNLEDRSVNGSKLFTSTVRDRVLIVDHGNSDPVWGLINHAMLEPDTVDASNIMDLAVTHTKIKEQAVRSIHIAPGAVLNYHLADGAVTSDKIWESPEKNRVLAAVGNNLRPIYTQVTSEMLSLNLIANEHIQDGSVTGSKLRSSPEDQMVMAVNLRNTTPQWMKITNKMISNRSVDGRTLMTSPTSETVLGVNKTGEDPQWVKINSRMILERAVEGYHLAFQSIGSEHLKDGIIEARHLAELSITGQNIAPRSIGPDHLFTTPMPEMVLGVLDPYSSPQWLKVSSPMIEDKAITKEKLFQADHSYQVLACTQAGLPPEYTRITHQFIVDGTILPAKLVHNFTLYGTPELTIAPYDDADNFQLANTAWVRRVVAQMIKDFNPEILFDTIDSTMIQDGSITGKKLFTSPLGPRVLGITAANEEVEFLLIEENLIADAAVSSAKLQRDIHLYGSPVLDVRPKPTASLQYGGGDLIPDCQWVLDRIAEAAKYGIGGIGGNVEWISGERAKFEWDTRGTSTDGEDEEEEETGPIEGTGPSTVPGYGSGSGSTCGYHVTDKVIGNIYKKAYNAAIMNSGVGGDVMPIDPTTPSDYKKCASGGGSTSGIVGLPGSITTELIQRRAVTGDKLFTSTQANRLLGVTEPGTDPKYLRVNNDMISDRVIDGRTLFTSEIPDRILGVKYAGANPEWMTINRRMLESNIIGTDELINKSVTHDKMAPAAVDHENLVHRPIIDSMMLQDETVTTQKIVDKAVDGSKIADKSIRARHIVDSIELPGQPSVAPSTRYEVRQLRNIILSPNKPSSNGAIKCKNGDIWFQYI